MYLARHAIDDGLFLEIIKSSNNELSINDSFPTGGSHRVHGVYTRECAWKAYACNWPASRPCSSVSNDLQSLVLPTAYIYSKLFFTEALF